MASAVCHAWYSTLLRVVSVRGVCCWEISLAGWASIVDWSIVWVPAQIWGFVPPCVCRVLPVALSLTGWAVELYPWWVNSHWVGGGAVGKNRFEPAGVGDVAVGVVDIVVVWTLPEPVQWGLNMLFTSGAEAGLHGVTIMDSGSGPKGG